MQVCRSYSSNSVSIITSHSTAQTWKCVCLCWLMKRNTGQHQKVCACVCVCGACSGPMIATVICCLLPATVITVVDMVLRALWDTSNETQPGRLPECVSVCVCASYLHPCVCVRVWSFALCVCNWALCSCQGQFNSVLIAYVAKR